MILTGFPAPALLYMRMKLLWTLPEFCYILTSESERWTETERAGCSEPFFLKKYGLPAGCR